jgi:hypothetical protein
VYFSNRFLRSHRRMAAFAVAPVMAFHAVVAGPNERRQTETRKDKCRKQSSIQS